MKPEEWHDFIDLMEDLSKNFRGEIDTPKMKLYFYQLKRYKLSAVRRGVEYLIDTKVYPDFPIVGHITKAIKDSKHRNITRIDNRK